MKRLALAALIAVGVSGCESDPVSVDGCLVAVAVVIDSVPWAPTGTLDPGRTVGSEVLRVTRRVDCSDGVWLSETEHVSAWCPLGHGESNYLPAGTPIHRIEGEDPDGLLTVYYDEVWEVLHPMTTVGD